MGTGAFDPGRGSVGPPGLGRLEVHGYRGLRPRQRLCRPSGPVAVLVLQREQGLRKSLAHLGEDLRTTPIVVPPIGSSFEDLSVFGRKDFL